LGRRFDVVGVMVHDFDFSFFLSFFLPDLEIDRNCTYAGLFFLL